MIRFIRQRVPRPTRPGWDVIVVVLVAAALSAPRLGHLLPAVQDHADEIYQPLRALKFAANGGQAFHKYGPAPNFVLLPAYAATMGYWKVTGQFTRPESDYPFGLARPVEQMGTLIFQSRLIFLLLGLLGLGLLTAAARRLTASPLAAAAAGLVVVATNYRVQWQLPTPMPDAAMTAFLLMATAAWTRMASGPITPWRGAAFAAAAAMAAGSKENSIPILLAMTLALAGLALFRSRGADPATRRTHWRALAAVAGVGLGLYALTNVVYAPHVWLDRMSHWLDGPGIDGDVWGRSRGLFDHLRALSAAALNNLGPAGAVIVPVALVAALWRRPPTAGLLLIPAAVGLLVVIRIPYVVDRFLTPALVTLTPAVALGLAALLARPGATRKAVVGLLALAVAVNAYWSGVAYHLAAVTEQAMIERALPPAPDGRTIVFGTMAAEEGGLYRLRHLGHRVDVRALQDLVAAGELPDVVYVSAGRLQFNEEARDMPARAATLRDDKDFDIASWPGFEALGYSRRRVEAGWPAWLWPLSWMPLNSPSGHADLLVFERRPEPATWPAADPR